METLPGHFLDVRLVNEKSCLWSPSAVQYHHCEEEQMLHRGARTHSWKRSACTEDTHIYRQEQRLPTESCVTLAREGQGGLVLFGYSIPWRDLQENPVPIRYSKCVPEAKRGFYFFLKKVYQTSEDLVRRPSLMQWEHGNHILKYKPGDLFFPLNKEFLGIC